MRVHIIAVGRLRAGPERELVTDYLTRFDRVGRGIGLGPAEVIEVEDRKGGGMDAEAALLEKALPTGALRCILDERGKVVSSPAFSTRLGRWRDAGRGDLALIIGGADGIAADFRSRADHALSLGAMVWPHMLVRVMLAEQLYRAATILSGGPYHRM
ncbi:MAG: 23S rRNA (pseudouridine(1915)-N(3))-methyltransferase RlmH [Pseudomonadota bacterium]